MLLQRIVRALSLALFTLLYVVGTIQVFGLGAAIAMEEPGFALPTIWSTASLLRARGVRRQRKSSCMSKPASRTLLLASAHSVEEKPHRTRAQTRRETGRR